MSTCDSPNIKLEKLMTTYAKDYMSYQCIKSIIKKHQHINSSTYIH